MRGAAAANQLSGNAGNDRILGFDGNDTLDGGDGQDDLDAGIGNDQVSSGDGNDTFLLSDDDTTACGGSGADTFTTTLLFGFSANIVGGGSGTDRLDFSTCANDSIRFTSGANFSGGFVQVHRDGILQVSATEIEAATIVGGRDLDQLSGTSGNDRLSGSSEIITGTTAEFDTDTLRGDGSNDTLIGGGGRDVLHGGTGADVFLFRSIADSVVVTDEPDWITDFDQTLDRIDLRPIDANVTTPGDQAFTLVTAYTGAAGQAWLQPFGAERWRLSLDRDGNGAAGFIVIFQTTEDPTPGLLL